jgi:predicted nuclease of restriction endonuclease-like (RecB) superfamily
MPEIIKREDALFEHISRLIDEARAHVKTAVNTAMVYTYYGVGQYIMEDEQQGEKRAGYGKAVLIGLSKRLTEKYGEGWSVETLKKCRFFFNVYSPQIGSTLSTQSENTPKFALSWSHYLVLMRIENPDERSFYEIECHNQNWSVRQLQRQYNSSLYERLALSRDKDEVMRLAKEGQTVEKPEDLLKNPFTLEFLGLEPDAAYTESKLEGAIISRIQTFLLEMGKGFLFEARQRRFTFDEDNFYVDLVLYNRLLQCYVLVDLKIDKLTHQDLGQMQMYVNYFDRYVRQPFEKPSVGILLCKEKNDALVELTLPKDANVYASAYQLYLPDKALLKAKMKEWIEEFENNAEL